MKDLTIWVEENWLFLQANM